MSQVSNNVVGPGGVGIPYTRVRFVLLTGDSQTPGFVISDGLTIDVADIGTITDANGSWTQELIPNSLIVPPDTRWMVCETPPGSITKTYVIEVPESEDVLEATSLLSDTPGALPSPPLWDHITSTEAHSAENISVEPFGPIESDRLQSVLEEIVAGDDEHVADPDPHPGYLTLSEAEDQFWPLSADLATQVELNAEAGVRANNDLLLATPDFLVGTSSGVLTNEIVVGASPGGELGGTWAEPTVDTTHSGSAHHAQNHDHSTAGDGQTLSPATLVIPSATAPAQTAEGSAVWDTNDDELTVGTGAGRKTLINSDNAALTNTRIPTDASVTPPKMASTIALVDGANIATDASLGNVFKVTLGGNRTINNPTNPTPGQRLIYRIKQDATGSRTVTWGSNFRFGTDVTLPTLSTTANKTDYVGFVYNNDDSKWDGVAVSRGY